MNKKSKFATKIFVNLITVAVFHCRYVIDKDIVESLFLVEYLYIYIYTFFYKQLASGFSPQSCLYFQGFGPQRCLMVS